MKKGKVLLLVALSGSLLASMTQVQSAFAAPGPCPKYKPGGNGVGKPIKVVTDARKVTAPLVVTLQTEPGAGFSSPNEGEETPPETVPHSYINVQVNTVRSSAKLFVRVEFLAAYDYDLYLRDSARVARAYAAGFNAVIVNEPLIGLDGTGHGGHSERGAEQIDGLVTPDCFGYTVDVVSSSTTGGPVTVKFWLAR